MCQLCCMYQTPGVLKFHLNGVVDSILYHVAETPTAISRVIHNTEQTVEAGVVAKRTRWWCTTPTTCVGGTTPRHDDFQVFRKTLQQRHASLHKLVKCSAFVVHFAKAVARRRGKPQLCSNVGYAVAIGLRGGRSTHATFALLPLLHSVEHVGDQ